MPLFNAVLLPSVGFRDDVVGFAQDNYAGIADGYCLSKTIYPHITLCQFEAEDQPMIFIDGLFNPVFEDFIIRDGEDIHDGYSFAEWRVKKEDWLIDLQAGVHEGLLAEGAKITSAQGDDYAPHLTFCRVPNAMAGDLAQFDVTQSKRPWIFTIGSSDHNGQFLG